MSTEDGLSTEIVQWLDDMSGYENIFSEGLLIIPIARYFRQQDFEVKGDTDRHFFQSDNRFEKIKGLINYDFYAKKDDGSSREELILELKWMKKATEDKRKKGSSNYSRIITDFIKLGIPTENSLRRLAVVALDPGLPYKEWFSQLMLGKKLELKVERNNESITLTAKNFEAAYLPFPFEDNAEIKRIFKQLWTYEIPTLELVITPPPTPAVSKSSVKVMVLSISKVHPIAS